MNREIPIQDRSRLRPRGRGRKVVIIVQNLPVPFDRRVWQEANELAANGYKVSIICPKGRGYEAWFEVLNGIAIYRHPLPYEAKGALGYALEYSWSLFWEFIFACWVMMRRGFDVIHACNPPDDIFLIGGFFKFFFGTKFLFDHHDINPELYEAKFGRRDFFYKIMLWWEKLTFKMADISIATNESYRKIAIERGRMEPDKVFIVRSGRFPNCAWAKNIWSAMSA
jgi:glycosyltransferase involved in cell wall biosynthesis